MLIVCALSLTAFCKNPNNCVPKSALTSLIANC